MRAKRFLRALALAAGLAAGVVLGADHLPVTTHDPAPVLASYWDID